MLHVTSDIWHVGGGKPSLSSLALTVWEWRWSEDISTKDDLLSQLKSETQYVPNLHDKHYPYDPYDYMNCMACNLRDLHYPGYPYDLRGCVNTVTCVIHLTCLIHFGHNTNMTCVTHLIHMTWVTPMTCVTRLLTNQGPDWSGSCLVVIK